ncbi:TetR family transcriptional regulator [Rhodococcus sp. T2V]|uniref:TetR/AcrR family transcriptional regulator n=1 Tax=Rhodococcus sp. T2V TaxID=3034164 RepID=UPI0023E1D1CB|nr:TetR family transcriptional regulator [Rhodococcus sp. T2V]MDF3309698.1 TetR family transcriptional regulator [Rhodococcus sp. T2V]
MNFQRARSDEQREIRRASILAVAASMLAEMPVTDISLNELSRRVGLAKSNVMRYFESREAILLELLDGELRTWADDLEPSPAPRGSALDRGDALAVLLSSTMASRDVMCDLIGAQAAVLERNISAGVALRHKRTTAVTVERIVTVILRFLPELTHNSAYEVVVATIMTGSAAWPFSRPSEALLRAYAEDPAIAASHISFAAALERSVQITCSGLLARQDA